VGNRGHGERCARLRADLELFVTGGFIDPGYLKRLQGGGAAWEIRSVRPRPSLRVFGCFAMMDVFVALNMWARRELGSTKSSEFRREAETCKARWRKLFHPYEPHKGGSLRDCISDNVANEAHFRD